MKHFALALAVSVSLCASAANAQTFSTLVSFTGTGGATPGVNPYGNLTLSGTTLYGLTKQGGSNGVGNLFSVGVDGSGYQNLLSFSGPGGATPGKYPLGSLTLSGTTFYGMTEQGGSNGDGNVFSVGIDGSGYQNLLSFSGTRGATPGQFPIYCAPTLSGTTLYGMTGEGGSNNRFGNLFSVGTDGSGYQNLLSFSGNGGATPGTWPFGSLTLSGTTFYGTTSQGSNTRGSVFSVGIDGSGYQNLLSFSGTEGTTPGALPYCSLTLSGTKLYGMTSEGGSNSVGNVFSVGTDGSGYHNLLSFTGTGGTASGNLPIGSLTLSGTTLYGMTNQGGANGLGNIFSIGVDGSGFQSLYSFSGGANGSLPLGDLTLSGGTLFGMTEYGGASNYGTAFAFALPTPEPGTLALVSCGAAALVAYRWRRRERRQEH